MCNIGSLWQLVLVIVGICVYGYCYVLSTNVHRIILYLIRELWLSFLLVTRSLLESSSSMRVGVTSLYTFLASIRFWRIRGSRVLHRVNCVTMEIPNIESATGSVPHVQMGVGLLD